MSYDVTALFTRVPVGKALELITERLQEDDTLPSRTEMTIPQIVELLDFCLNMTYFIYDGAYDQQTHGAAIGSPISPLVANCYMEQFEKSAISTAPHRTAPHRTAPHRTAPNRTEPNRTEPNRTEPNRTEPNRTEPNRTEPNRTEPNRTEPNRTEPNRTEPNRTHKQYQSTHQIHHRT